LREVVISLATPKMPVVLFDVKVSHRVSVRTLCCPAWAPALDISLARIAKCKFALATTFVPSLGAKPEVVTIFQHDGFLRIHIENGHNFFESVNGTQITRRK